MFLPSTTHIFHCFPFTLRTCSQHPLQLRRSTVRQRASGSVHPHRDYSELVRSGTSLEEDFSWAPSKQSTDNMISLFLPESSQKSLLLTKVNSNAFSPLLLPAMWIKDDTLTPHTRQAESSVALRLYNPLLHFFRTGNKIYLVNSSPFSLDRKHFFP